MLLSTAQQSDSVIYIHSLFHVLFHYGVPQGIEYSSLCYAVGPCCLSIHNHFLVPVILGPSGLSQLKMIHWLSFWRQTSPKRSQMKDTLTPAKPHMTLDNAMLSEISQSQKDKYCIIPLIWGTWSSKFTDTGSRMVATRRCGEGNGSCSINWYGFSVREDEKSYGDGWC